jgi:hypothetical protein
LQDQGFECEYVIGGVGPEHKALEELARKLGVEKKFKISSSYYYYYYFIA